MTPVSEDTQEMPMQNPPHSGEVDSFLTEEDALLYLQACIDEDKGDGKLILAVLDDLSRASKIGDLARDAAVVRDALRKAITAKNQEKC